MRELKFEELGNVAGGEGVCTPANSFGAISDMQSIGKYGISFYDDLVAATSRIIERVALAL